MVMKWKWNVAWDAVRKERYNNTTVWRGNRYLLEQENVIADFNRIWEKEKNEYKTLLREKRKRKVEFLWQKYGARNKNIVKEVAGITVADQQITQSFSSSPRCYGGV